MTDDARSMIEESAARLFAEQVDRASRDATEKGTFDAALWRQAVDSGFDKALAAEAAGGSAQPFAAAAPILRGLGYWQVPLPLAETMVAALLLSRAGLDVPEGPITIAEQGLDGDLTASGSGAKLRLAGYANRVAWAAHASWLLVSLADGSVALVELNTPLVERRPHANHAGLPDDTLVLQDTPCVAHAECLIGIDKPVWTLGALSRSLMMVGALEWILEQSARYATERVQFGKPIGKNQALQQQLAVLAGDTAAARVAALVAAEDAPGFDRGDAPSALFSIAVAKVRAGEAATRGTSIAHQVHGAIGFTHEHALHFATRRLWAWRQEFGSDAWWAGRLGRAAVAAGSYGFWPSLTERRFADLVLP